MGLNPSAGKMNSIPESLAISLTSSSLETFEKGLRTLNSAKDRILVANLSMGLNHITLQDGLTPLDVLKKLF